MSNEQEQSNDDVTPDIAEHVDELGLLKQRARMMNINFSNNISLETLRAKIKAKQEGEVDPEAPEVPLLVDPVDVQPEGKVLTLRQRVMQKNMKLIRLRITNLNPNKKDLPGEIITVANEYLGTVRKYVPFGEVTDNGYHVPYCIYKYLDDKKFLNIRTYKDRKNQNQIQVEQSWAKEFALEILPQLTQDELDKLGAAQTASGGIG